MWALCSAGERLHHPCLTFAICGSAHCGRNIEAWPDKARKAVPGQGPTKRGKLCQGKARQSEESCARARPDKARKAVPIQRPDKARKAVPIQRPDKARKAVPIQRPDKARKAVPIQGPTKRGKLCQGKARQSEERCTNTKA